MDEKEQGIERTRQLNHLVLTKFKNIHAFADAINMSYTTLRSILAPEHNLNNTGVLNVIKICRALDIDTDAFVEEGRIVSRTSGGFELSLEEKKIIEQYRDLDRNAQNRVMRNLKGEHDDALASFQKDLPTAIGAG